MQLVIDTSSFGVRALHRLRATQTDVEVLGTRASGSVGQQPQESIGGRLCADLAARDAGGARVEVMGAATIAELLLLSLSLGMLTVRMAMK